VAVKGVWGRGREKGQVFRPLARRGYEIVILGLGKISEGAGPMKREGGQEKEKPLFGTKKRGKTSEKENGGCGNHQREGKVATRAAKEWSSWGRDLHVTNCLGVKVHTETCGSHRGKEQGSAREVVKVGKGRKTVVRGEKKMNRFKVQRKD